MSAKQEDELIESMICETKELLAGHIRNVGGVKKTDDEAIARLVFRLNLLHQMKDAMKERTMAGHSIH